MSVCSHEGSVGGGKVGGQSDACLLPLLARSLGATWTLERAEGEKGGAL